MAQFIDYGSPTSDNGPQSSIGSYENDSFIDDNEIDDNVQPSIERGHSWVPLRPISQSASRRSGSGLFVTPGPHERGRGSVQGGGSRVRRLRSEASGSGGSSTPLIRRTNARVRQPSSHSSVESWIRVLQQRERPTGDEVSFHSRENSAQRSVHRSVTEPDSVGAERLPTPDPFQIPDHLDGNELRGVGVASKRLGNGRPRWSARYFLFTFSQSGFDWPYEKFIEIVDMLGGKHHISRERHEDGGYHFHCFVDFERKFETENVHRFCVGPPQTDPSRKCPVTTHCNILPVPRTPFNAWDYVSKYGDIVSSTLERPRARGPNVTRDDMWTGSVALANKKAFLDDVQKHSARDFVLFNRQISGFATKTWGRDVKDPKLPRIEEDGVFVHWERYPEAKRWILESLSEPIARIKSMSRGASYTPEDEQRDIAWLADRPNVRIRRPKSLIVWGPSRLGKTIFATNLGKHVHWQRDFNLRKLLDMDLDEVEYAVFDDISWKNSALKGEGFKAWLGGNDEFDVSDKYEHKHVIKWGRPCIVVSNRDPYSGLDPEDAEWFDRNCITIALGDWDDLRSNAICSSDAHAEI